MYTFILDTCLLIQNVKGGVITYTADVLDQVNLATANFAANNTDPKAAIITSYNYLLIEASPFAAPSLKSDSTDLVAGCVRDHIL